MKLPILSAAVLLLGAVSAANADFIITSSRTTTTIPNSASVIGGASAGQAVDVVTFKIQNDGTNGTGTKLNGINLTASTAGTAAGTAMVFQTVDDIGDGGLSVNTAGNPNILFGSANGSYIRFGGFSSFSAVYSVSSSTGLAIPGGVYPENRQDPSGTGSTSYDPTVNYTNNHSFSVVGGVLGGIPDTSAVNLASIVVPVDTTVTLSGTVGGDQGAAVDVNAVNAVAVPEPASLSALALGGIALIVRRRKA